MLTLYVIFNLIPKLALFELGIIKVLFKIGVFLEIFAILAILIIFI